MEIPPSVTMASSSPLPDRSAYETSSNSKARFVKQAFFVPFYFKLAIVKSYLTSTMRWL